MITKSIQQTIAGYSHRSHGSTGRKTVRHG